MYWMSLVIIFAPLLGSLVLLFSRDLSETYSAIIANLSIAISALTSLGLLIPFLFNNGISKEFFLYTWYLTGDYHFQLGLLVDSLTAVMAFIVSFISFFVHMYSITYMHNDNSFKRFFIYTNFLISSFWLVSFLIMLFNLFYVGNLFVSDSYFL